MLADMQVCGMRTEIIVDVNAADRARLEATVAESCVISSGSISIRRRTR